MKVTGSIRIMHDEGRFILTLDTDDNLDQLEVEGTSLSEALLLLHEEVELLEAM